MAHTRNQDFDTTHNQTKNEINALTSNIATPNSKFETLSDNVKNLTTLSRDVKNLTAMINQFQGPISSKQPSHHESVDFLPFHVLSF